jgi:UDP-glucuronate 4-epimerase
MNVLLTGVAGFIGSHLCEYLLDRGDRVVGLDSFNDYYDPRIKESNVRGFLAREGFELVRGDILDTSLLQRLFDSHGFDAVVHLAARAGVRPSISQPELYEQVNVQGTLNLLEQCRHHGAPRFVFGSSSSVYGNNTSVPFREDDRVDHPISPYAATKKAGELVCYTYHHLYGIPVTCLRFFTVYGPRQRPDMAIHKFARLIDHGRQIPLFGDGTTRRDYTFIADIIDGVVRALDRCDGYRIYNLGESQTIELIELVRLLEDRLDKKASIEYLPMQPGDVAITYADITRARHELGYAPRYPIESGITEFVQWYREIGRQLEA